MRSHHLDLGRVVLERGADLAAFELVVFVATHAERRAELVERAIQIPGAAAQRERVAARRELQDAALDHRNPVFRVVVSVAAAEVPARACPRESDACRIRCVTGSWTLRPQAFQRHPTGVLRR